MTISSEAPVTKPVITAFETKLTRLPNRSSPMRNIVAPTRKVTVKRAAGIWLS